MTSFPLELALESRLGPRWAQGTGGSGTCCCCRVGLGLAASAVCFAEGQSSLFLSRLPSCCQRRTRPARQVCDPL